MLHSCLKNVQQQVHFSVWFCSELPTGQTLVMENHYILLVMDWSTTNYGLVYFQCKVIVHLTHYMHLADRFQSPVVDVLHHWRRPYGKATANFRKLLLKELATFSKESKTLPECSIQLEIFSFFNIPIYYPLTLFQNSFGLFPKCSIFCSK